jgi:hypothetical protein
MRYFKFDIPKGLGYSPGWHGTLDKCPSDVEVLLYNEREGFGIACTPDKTLPKGITAITEEEALSTMTTIAFSKAQTDLYYGDKLYDKWIPEPIEEVPDTIAELLEVSDGR